jgi:hypothetical protein
MMKADILDVYVGALINGEATKEDEAILMQSPRWAAYYAINVRGRWKEAESIIQTNDFAWGKYLNHFGKEIKNEVSRA